MFYSEKGQVTAFCKNFGYIGAVPLIFSASLRENILYGNNQNIQDKEIIDFLKDLIHLKKNLVITLIERDNKSLSSGQMQKIAFVRALLSDLDVLLLDESTANLDDKSRQYILKF